MLRFGQPIDSPIMTVDNEVSPSEGPETTEINGSDQRQISKADEDTGDDGQADAPNDDNNDAKDNVAVEQRMDNDTGISSQARQSTDQKKNTNTDAATDATSTNSVESISNSDNVADTKHENVHDKDKGTPFISVSTPKSDPDAIKLRFLFANRDGLNVSIECKVTDTVGEIKGALLSVWPKDLPECGGGESLRLICMGKGILMPDSKTLADFQVPVFKTHPTPINVSVKPDHVVAAEKAKKSSPNNNDNSSSSVNQGCSCVIL